MSEKKKITSIKNDVEGKSVQVSKHNIGLDQWEGYCVECGQLLFGSNTRQSIPDKSNCICTTTELE